ncbi:hypothetical protein OPV22_011536 [Ensete ventricosum]|uniref:Uncharacterized protein n=1 Tax=Ensete ventricosum TaxID=4639 RepID=A0AAV8RLN6_ENSVE|nr:hypothetical protein OPV22_011536 [Ensete ventricosum]
MRPGSPQTPNFECSNNLLMSGLISVAIRVRDLDQEQHLLGCSCELAEDKYKCQTLQSGSYTEKSPVDRLVREHGMAWRRPGQAYLIDSLIFQSHYYSTAADILNLGFCCRVGEALKRCRDTCFGRNSGLLAAGSRRCWSSPRAAYGPLILISR